MLEIPGVCYNPRMNQALTIGHLRFNSPLIQGPLAGYSCAPMRVQTWRYGHVAYCSTEMVSATHLARGGHMPARYCQRDVSEGPLSFQLSASNPDDLIKALPKVHAVNPEIIELNCGCPVAKIRKKRAGSYLLSDLDQLKRLVSTLRQHTQAAVSIKIRVAGDENDQDDIAIARAIADNGADCLVVHGRHWTERYDVPCRLDSIASLVKAVDIPVIANGDVIDQASCQQTIEQTGCAGIMIARAALGQPWLFQQISDTNFIPPSIPEVIECFLDHIHRLAAVDSPFRALLQARKIIKYYTRDLFPNKQHIHNNIMQCQDLSKLATCFIKTPTPLDDLYI